MGLRGIPPFTGVALRFALASVALLALVPFFGVKLGRSPIERRLWWANAFLTFCIPYGLLYWAEQWVPSGLASVIFATFPLLTALTAHFLLAAERLTRRSVTGILVGFVGVAVIFSEDFRALGGPQVAKAAALFFLGPLCAAVGNVLVKRWGGDIHPLSITAVPMGITAVLMGALAWTVERDHPMTFDTPSVVSLVYLALVGSSLPFTLYFWLLRHQSATALSMINYATPVLAVIVGSVFLAEPFTLRILLGSALVLAGVAVTVRPARLSESAAPAPGASG